MTRPACGGTGLASSVISIWSAISVVMGVVLAVAGLPTAFIPNSGSTAINLFLTQIVGELEKELLGFILNAFGLDVGKLGIAAYAVPPTEFFVIAAIVIAALIAAAIMIYWAWSNWVNLCGSPTFGVSACITGVVNDVAAAFTTPHSVLFGFTGNQPRADVVVKSVYWPLVTLNAPSFVLCSGCANCTGSDIPADPAAGCSPEIPCIFHDSKVCGAAFGGAIGATIGAAIGAAVGIGAGIALMAAVGCLATGPVAWACWLALLVAIIVAIVVVVAVALIGAIIGSLSGQAASGGSSVPGGSAPLTPGTYVTITGNLAMASQTARTNAIWFAGWVPDAATHTVVDESASNNNGTSILGQSTGTAPFCFTDPDANIPAALDVCPLPPS